MVTKTIATMLTALFVSEANGGLVNTSFEENKVPERSHEIFHDDNVTGWNSSSDMIDIWGNLYRGIPAIEENNFLMIPPGTKIYQDFIINNSFEWSFYHRPRAGWDQINFNITDLGTDFTYNTADDVEIVDLNYTSLIPEWTEYSGIVSKVNNPLRITFYSVNTTSANGNNILGNYIDGIKTKPVSIPGASSIFLFLLAGVFSIRKR
jgi:hypothetical protein